MRARQKWRFTKDWPPVSSEERRQAEQGTVQAIAYTGRAARSVYFFAVRRSHWLVMPGLAAYAQELRRALLPRRVEAEHRCRASTSFFLVATKTRMAGTSPAMMIGKRRCN
jgi:hypothetical protein